MKKAMLTTLGIFCSIPVLLFAQGGVKKEKPKPVSQETSACLGCHREYTPGIVEDWLKSRHSMTTPSSALKRPEIERRMSSNKVAPALRNVVVGCYECHSLNPAGHKDNFDHMGFKINVIVSPNDCATCHPVEVKEFSGSKKAHAVGNLTKNPIYHTLVETVISKKAVKEGKIVQLDASDFTRMETCFSCHGTEVKVGGMQEVETKMGKIEVPTLTQWPNQGTGRINPDGSLGACSACHARHEFSIEVARKPYTCAQCHLEPDVPAWNVYHESKHGDIYLSNYQRWNFTAVPWKVGRDFQVPTCSTCHNSLITGPDGKKVAERSHDFGARLWVRLFGLIYSHPQPKHGDTSVLRNKDGLPLPTAFTGEIATEGLLGQDEQTKRRKLVSGVCNSCHSTSWVNRHFEKLENTIKEVDSLTLASTLLLVEAWNHGLAEGLPHGKNPFDEAIEQMWIRQWLFYANSIKYASAMTGAPDYATFKNGWWNLTENLQQMKDWVELMKKAKAK
jgi:hydroxylamine dehydrogenase